ncbi:LPS O-antigen length regulator [Escherichia coli]|jgi:Chain length determinant protein|nr:LPS O-antigen length regulator [Escherichia coli]EIP6835330.1 LPS O-antigen length regulator [Escherichia coli]EIP6896847.1 LPS O-antigen length regulator [Escherichia coli]EJS8731400.1 LPS O-antigen length regulator [Escherichia coli]RDS12970.1 Ferric enterobactin transport protein FepE [Escherichia coli]
MNIKKISDERFSDYNMLTHSNKEIDLFDLIYVLWTAKTKIVGVALFFACIGFLISFILPQKWTSSAVVTPAEPVQWSELNKELASLHVLGVDFDINRDSAFNLFIKKFQSVNSLNEYMRSSPYVIEMVKKKNISALELHRAIVALSENMKSVDDNASKKNDKSSLYVSWTLSFTAPTSREAHDVLSGYINYVSSLVVKELMEDVKNKLEIKTKFEKEILALDKIKIRNQLNADIRRLDYSLEVANSAGIKKPVYSNGQIMKDDPDFPVALGSDGIATKLNIKKSIKDVSELSGELRNRQYIVEQLVGVKVGNVDFMPFQYQLSPTSPVKKDGPSNVIIVILSSIIGGMLACGSVLLRHAMEARKLSGIEEKLG